ncbi:STAS domain-containing protein [Streptomyces sp. NPDC048419]|uniref:STAS domain-containing protein n=1 Tax=Streptomyces sp. NPDC048419 TaxID=3365547 RepID=UPI0037158898
MEELLQACSVWHGDTVLLSLAGELDLATVPLLKEAVAACLARRPHCVRLDLADLTFCDGTGLQALRRVSDAVHTADATFCLVNIHPNVERTLDRLGAASPWSPPTILH